MAKYNIRELHLNKNLSEKNLKYFNLGCGSRYSPMWFNIDFYSNSPDVISWDLQKGIPLDKKTADVIYSSHLLEHFKKEDAKTFIGECYRVLKPGGVLRLAVPDLEKITRKYLECLEQGFIGSEFSDERYNWILLELFDQMVREKSGGYMADFLKKENLPIEDFIYERIGDEGRKIINWMKSQNVSTNQIINVKTLSKHYNPINFFPHIKSTMKRLLRDKVLSQEEKRAIEIGRFRMSGEIHQWMYDRYSLKRLLSDCGFADIIQRTASVSYIENWQANCLDTNPDGTIYKPDSLFMEAIKL